MSFCSIEELDPLADFPLIFLVQDGKITNVSDIHLGVEEASKNEKPGGRF
jgi:hypothetical protein